MAFRFLAVVALACALCSSAGARGTSTCAGVPGFTCSVLTVPLDHSGKRAGVLHLNVAAENDVHAPKGVLLVLTGGPGQPAVALLQRLVQGVVPAELNAYRVVVYDQRGTGSGALDCSALQDAMGSSDLTTPPASAVRACAAKLGTRRQFFGTDDVVADMEGLRKKLGVRKWSIDGISYGTYVGERYALAHPTHVNKLVLDSVVPHVGEWDTGRDEFRGVRRVLHAVCGDACLADLAVDVVKYHDGPQLFDAITLLSIADPTYRNAFDLSKILSDARHGHAQGLLTLLQSARMWQQAIPEELDQGLHASTLCADWRWPWGTSAAPLAGRARKLDAAVARMTDAQLYPFDAATAKGNGFVRQCLPWAPTPPTPLARGKITVPTLLLEGDRDISTQIGWAREELRMTTRGQLVIVPGAGHSVQSRARSDVGRDAVKQFLLS